VYTALGWLPPLVVPGQTSTRPSAVVAASSAADGWPSAWALPGAQGAAPPVAPGLAVALGEPPVLLPALLVTCCQAAALPTGPPYSSPSGASR
jgi:hypothetical protein